MQRNKNTKKTGNAKTHYREKQRRIFTGQKHRQDDNFEFKRRASWNIKFKRYESRSKIPQGSNDNEHEVFQLRLNIKKEADLKIPTLILREVEDAISSLRSQSCNSVKGELLKKGEHVLHQKNNL